MRDSLPKSPWREESGIINLDDSSSNGTHWVAYKKNKKVYITLIVFGNLQPPKEIVKYFGNNINYNYERKQDFNSTNCGHLSLQFLHSISS